jgi:hypothetical protein
VKYEKPEVVRVASAIEAVQNHSNKEVKESFDGSDYCSTNAYAADE